MMEGVEMASKYSWIQMLDDEEIDFIKSLDYLDGEITEFNEELWVGLLDYIIIKDKSHCTVVFKGGSKLDV